MLNRRTSPGFFQWLFVVFIIGLSVLLLIQLYNYGQERQLFPAGLEVAGVDVGGMSRDEAERLLTERYLEAPVVLKHGENPIEIRPQRAEFTLDFDTMMNNATNERDNQDFWAGFWGFIWNRPVDVTAVELEADLNDIALRSTLEILSQQFDVEPREPQTISGSMSYQAGAPGIKTNIDTSLKDVKAAFRRPTSRTATLQVESVEHDEPEIGLLRSLLTNTIQQYENVGGGRSSVFVINLNTGDEIGHNADFPMPGMSVLRIPVMVEALRRFSETPTPEELALLREAAIESTNNAANELLIRIADVDEDDVEPETGLIGAERVSATMQSLGLRNTFLGCPFEFEEVDECAENVTEAFQAATTDPTLEPNPSYQTTAKDIALLLGMLYDCSMRGGGTLLALYGDDFSAEKCSIIIDILKTNQIGSLIEEGVPSDLAIAHRHGWQSDTNGDAGIIFSDGAHYILAEFTHKPGWLAWEVSSPLMADLSRATYNFFNFDDQWLGQQ